MILLRRGKTRWTSNGCLVTCFLLPESFTSGDRMNTTWKLSCCVGNTRRGKRNPSQLLVAKIWRTALSCKHPLLISRSLGNGRTSCGKAFSEGVKWREPMNNIAKKCRSDDRKYWLYISSFHSLEPCLMGGASHYPHDKPWASVSLSIYMEIPVTWFLLTHLPSNMEQISHA